MHCKKVYATLTIFWLPQLHYHCVGVSASVLHLKEAKHVPNPSSVISFLKNFIILTKEGSISTTLYSIVRTLHVSHTMGMQLR